MKNYFSFIGLVLISVIGAFLLAGINTLIYVEVFGSFPYPIVDFCFIILPIWFVIISLIIFSLREYFVKLKTTYIDIVIVSCAVFGLMGFFDLQIGQKVKVLENSEFRYNEWRQDVINTKTQFQNFIGYIDSGDNNNIYGYNADFYSRHIIKLDSILNFNTNSDSYLKEIRSNACIENPMFITLAINIEEYETAHEEFVKAKSELKNEKTNEFKDFYIMFFLSALLLSIFKMTIEYVKMIKPSS